MFECIYDEVEASQDTARTEQDLTAQQRAAWAALAGAGIALLTLIVTGIGVWFVKRTLDATLKAVEDTSEATVAMRRQNEIAKDTAERQLRAYITLETAGVHHFEDEVEAVVQVVMKNTGQTPAILFGSRGQLQSRRSDLDAIEIADSDISARQTIIGPGATTETMHYLRRGFSAEHKMGIISGTYRMWVMGRLQYTDTFGRSYDLSYKASADQPEINGPLHMHYLIEREIGDERRNN